MQQWVSSSEVSDIKSAQEMNGEWAQKMFGLVSKCWIQFSQSICDQADAIAPASTHTGNSFIFNVALFQQHGLYSSIDDQDALIVESGWPEVLYIEFAKDAMLNDNHKNILLRTLELLLVRTSGCTDVNISEWSYSAQAAKTDYEAFKAAGVLGDPVAAAAFLETSEYEPEYWWDLDAMVIEPEDFLDRMETARAAFECDSGWRSINVPQDDPQAELQWLRSAVATLADTAPQVFSSQWGCWLRKVLHYLKHTQQAEFPASIEREVGPLHLAQLVLLDDGSEYMDHEVNTYIEAGESLGVAFAISLENFPVIQAYMAQHEIAQRLLMQGAEIKPQTI